MFPGNVGAHLWFICDFPFNAVHLEGKKIWGWAEWKEYWSELGDMCPRLTRLLSSCVGVGSTLTSLGLIASLLENEMLLTWSLIPKPSFQMEHDSLWDHKNGFLCDNQERIRLNKSNEMDVNMAFHFKLFLFWKRCKTLWGGPSPRCVGPFSPVTVFSIPD